MGTPAKFSLFARTVSKCSSTSRSSCPFQRGCSHPERPEIIDSNQGSSIMDPPAAVSEETNGNGTADQSEVLNASEGEETLVVPRDRKVVTKKLQLEDPANVPTNFNDYLNDTTGSESTPVLKNAPAIPTPVITPAVDAPTTASESEKEAQEEEASISLQ